MPGIDESDESWCCIDDKEKVDAFRKKWGLDEYHSPEAIKEIHKNEVRSSHIMRAMLPEGHIGLSFLPFYIGDEKVSAS